MNQHHCAIQLLRVQSGNGHDLANLKGSVRQWTSLRKHNGFRPLVDIILQTLGIQVAIGHLANPRGLARQRPSFCKPKELIPPIDIAPEKRV